MEEDYADLFTDKDEFRRILKDCTQDHGMLIVDQMEAHFSPEDMFFQHTANPDPDPFTIGTREFWKQSGNNHKLQMEIYANVAEHHEKKRKDWKVIADRVWKEEKEKVAQEDEMEQDRIQTNNWNFASEDQQNSIKQSIAKKALPKGGSHVAQARKRIQGPELMEYIPSPDMGRQF